MSERFHATRRRNIHALRVAGRFFRKPSTLPIELHEQALLLDAVSACVYNYARKYNAVNAQLRNDTNCVLTAVSLTLRFRARSVLLKQIQNAVRKSSPINRRVLAWFSFVAITALVQLFSGCNREQPVAPIALSENPHVVLIVLDTLRADAVGCYGGPDGVSPEIDAFASEGVRFDHVVAPSNWTKPSWAGMLTARYPRSLGVYKEIGECLPDNALTLAESFQAAGYRTFGATANPNINSAFNYQQGFDEYRDSHVIWDWMEITGTGEGKPNADQARLAPATELYREALTWAGEQRGESSFIQICTMEMHEYHRGEFSLNRAEFKNGFADQNSPEREYYQALKQSSYDLKQFVANLRAIPGWHDVLVVITSDHGEGLSDHPDVSRAAHHGGVMYDSNLHVPLIMHRPGALPKGRVVDEPVRLLDLAPTILEAAGLPLLQDVDGVSWMPHINGAEPAESPSQYFVSESYLRDLEKISIETEEWRYIENRDQANTANAQRGQLNPAALQKIGSAQNGKATDQIENYPDVASSLRERLRTWEQAYPKSDPSVCSEPISDEERDQLESIGYW